MNAPHNPPLDDSDERDATGESGGVATLDPPEGEELPDEAAREPGVVGRALGSIGHWFRVEGRYWLLSIGGHAAVFVLLGLVAGTVSQPQTVGELVLFEVETELDTPEMVTVELSEST